MTKKSILMVLTGMVLLCAPISANAQAAKNATKVVKAIINATKKAKKAPVKKAPTKTTTTSSSKTYQPMQITCINCSGKGYKNGYKCSICDGTGKKYRVVRR